MIKYAITLPARSVKFENLKGWEMRTKYWLLILFVVSLLAHAWGIDRGGLGMLQASRESDEKQDKAYATALESQKKCYETLLASQKTRYQEAERWAREDIALLERDRDLLETALHELFRNVDFELSLEIQWNQKRLQPWTGVVLFNADTRPDRFTDKRGFIFLHLAKKGERAVYLGEGGGRVMVLCLTGDFAGRLLTFRPWQRFDRQGALVYHF